MSFSQYSCWDLFSPLLEGRKWDSSSPSKNSQDGIKMLGMELIPAWIDPKIQALPGALRIQGWIFGRILRDFSCWSSRDVQDRGWDCWDILEKLRLFHDFKIQVIWDDPGIKVCKEVGVGEKLHNGIAQTLDCYRNWEYFVLFKPSLGSAGTFSPGNSQG